MAKILLPLKCLAFGVPVNAFLDYFQLSPTLAKLCYEIFVLHIPLLWSNKYLAAPTKKQVGEIVALHKAAHGVPGMLGSLDCMHTYWDKCPKAYHGAFKGKEKRPSIVLEAASDYNLYFWHCAYGFPGSFNDINIINASSLLTAFLDGSMEENESHLQFRIGEDEFRRLYFLVDGIYPRWARFVKAITETGVNSSLSSYKIWQEKVRKDIERAFGVLQIEFPIVACPFKFHKSEIIANTVTTCLILHNMCVHERVNETIDGDYLPIYMGNNHETTNVATLNELEERADNNTQDAVVSYDNSPLPAQHEMALLLASRYDALINEAEHMRLRNAISEFVHENHLYILK